MSEIGYWKKTSKLDEGFIGTAIAAAINTKKQKKLVFVGILTVTNTGSGLTSDTVGQRIQNTIDQMKIFQVIVKIRKIISCNSSEVASTLKSWADNLGLDIILTIGGTGIEPTAVTPEATKQIIDKELSGMSFAMIMSAIKADPLAILFRGVCGIRNNTLVVNLPDNAQRAADNLSVILPYIPNAIECLKGGQVDERPSGRENIVMTASNPTTRSHTAGHVTSLSRTSSPGHHVVPSATAHHLPPSHHATTVHHLQTPSSLPDPVIDLAHRFPSHHQSERLHTEVVASNDHHAAASEEDLQLTEDDIFAGDSFDSLIAKESIKVVGNPPVQMDLESADSAVFASSSLGPDYSKIARRPRVSPFPELSIDRALAAVFAITNPFPVVDKSYKEALDHVLARDVITPGPVPAINTAILDGYAVIAADASGDLEVVELPRNELLTLGKAVRVTTGAPMPLGADAVIIVEETLLLSEAEDGRKEVSIRCLSRATPGQHVLPRGSDIREGEVVVKAGTNLGHLEVALLASLGVSTVSVHKHPVVAVISYGAKLREPDDRDIAFDEIRDTNRLTLLMSLKKKGYPVVDMGIVNKGSSALKEAITRAYEKADVIVTTGGAAIGENDVVKPVLLEIGTVLHFGRVTMKPGAPTGFASLETQRGRKFFFTLAGVPVPAYIGYYLFVLPCLRRLHGIKDPRSAVIKVKVSSDISLDTVPELQRASLRNDEQAAIPWADVTGRQVNSRMLSLVAADALLLLPAKSDERQFISRGELVDAMLIV